jgi:hypothetical protein
MPEPLGSSEALTASLPVRASLADQKFRQMSTYISNSPCTGGNR